MVVRHKRLIVFERKQHKNVFSFGHKITFFITRLLHHHLNLQYINKLSNHYSNKLIHQQIIKLSHQYIKHLVGCCGNYSLS